MQDEPTSGLDARAAAIVMRTVRNTVNTGRTVVCTIHQPSIDIFEVRFHGVLIKNTISQILAAVLQVELTITSFSDEEAAVSSTCSTEYMT